MISGRSGRHDECTADAEEVVTLKRRVATPHVLEGALAMAALALGGSDPDRALALACAAAESAEYSLSWGMVGDLAARRGDKDKALQYFA